MAALPDGRRRRCTRGARVASARGRRLRAPPSRRPLRRRAAARRRRRSRELPEAIRLLGELPFRAIVTTAYDDAFERAFTKDGVGAAHLHAARLTRRSRTTASCASSSRRSAIRRAPTRSSGRPRICNAALADGGYRTVAHDLYRSRSFLFVGFDGRDPDLAILLERVLAGARAGEVEHFAVLPGARRRREGRAVRRLSHSRAVGRERGRAGAAAQGRRRRRDRRRRCPTTTTSRAGWRSSPRSRGARRARLDRRSTR